MRDLLRSMAQALAIELDELADDAKAPQPLRDGEHEVGRGHAFVELAAEPKADHLWDQHRDRLAQHRGFRLDAADAPTEHGEAVDHGGVTVGADQRIGEGDRSAVLLPRPHRLRQIFEIDLVADTGAGRNHAEIVERGRAPAQEGVTLVVALILPLDIDVEGARIAEGIDHHRMIDDEIDGDERVDLARVAFQPTHGVAHHCEVDHGRNASEVLHQHPRRPKRDLAVAFPLLQPVSDAANVVGGNGAPVLVPEQILKQHLERERQAVNALKAVGLGLLQAEIVVVSLARL
jgi:hypothetical protein